MVQQMIKFGLLGLVLLSILTAPLSTKAQGSTGLTMSAQAAYDGYFKYGEWLPLFVNLSGGETDLQGEIRVAVTGQTGTLYFSVPAELPRNTRKQFTLYTLPNNFSRELKVEFLENDKVLLHESVDVTVVFNDRYVIGVLASNPERLNVLRSLNFVGRRENPEVIPLTLEEIPDQAAGLRLFNALILNDVDTSSLIPAQQTALKNWIAGGGRLILGGGLGTPRTLSGLSANLQPVTLLGQHEIGSLTALESYTKETLQTTDSFLVADVEPTDNTTTLLNQTDSASNQEIPLILEQRLGSGYIDFIALDLTQSPFNTWTGLVPMFETLLTPGAAWSNDLPPDVAPQQMKDSQMTYALGNLPALDLPSIRFLGFMLIGYIILIGPVNYALLRWRDKLAWAWLTIPALTIAFAGLTYGVGLQLRGSDIIINQISIIQTSANGQTSNIRNYVGVFSPNRQTYDVEVQAQALVRPLGENYDPWRGETATGDMKVVQGNPAKVSGLAVNQWSMQSFVAETNSLNNFEITSNATINRNSLSGNLINPNDVIIKDVIVLFNSQFKKLGDIQPNQTVDFEFNFDNDTIMRPFFGSYMIFEAEFNRGGPPNREINFKQNVLDSAIFNTPDYNFSNGPLFIGWLDDSPLEVTIEGSLVNTQESSLLYGSLPLNLDENVSALPPGFSRSEVISIDRDAGPCGYGGTSQGYYVYQGTTEIKITLPEFVRNVSPTALDLYIRNENGWQTIPEVALYDLSNEDWIIMEEAALGANAITNFDQFYNQTEGSIQVRLTQDNREPNTGCIFLDLAFEGEVTG